jgi:hypothetical protein
MIVPVEVAGTGATAAVKPAASGRGKRVCDVKNAIICDIDGTLADVGDRHPFDFHLVDRDTVKHATAEAVRVFHRAGYAIILLSGREESCRDLTIGWLQRNDIPFDSLHLRRTGDRRKDNVVKREMYNQVVLGKYSVLLVLDDRNQVVDMWRKDLGLACFQVDYGDF